MTRYCAYNRRNPAFAGRRRCSAASHPLPDVRATSVFESMDDAAFEDALRRILASSSSAEEVRQRLRDELGYPYIIAITMEPLGEPWGGFQYAVMANGPSGEIINITH